MDEEEKTESGPSIGLRGQLIAGALGLTLSSCVSNRQNAEEFKAMYGSPPMFEKTDRTELAPSEDKFSKWRNSP